MSISQVTLVSGPTTCTIGQQVTIGIKVQWLSTANGRYDVAAYIGTDGGNAVTGTCYESILSPITTDAGSANLGTQANPSTGPFLDTNGDQCGDLSSTSVVWQLIPSITITCRDLNHDGVADFSACTSWNQNQNDNHCTGPTTAICGSPSKCRCDSVLDILGLSTCLQSQPSCTAATDSSNSCNGDIFAALFRVTTTANTVSTVFPPSSISTGYIYYDFIPSPGTTMAWAFFAPGTPVTSPGTIVRQDLLNPCKVQRQAFCGGLTSCQQILETQPLPRFFHESGDVACTGINCAGASRAPAACSQGYTKTTSTSSDIKYIWTLADKITPCAALGVDGTFYEFFTTGGTTAGVIDLGTAKQQPGDTTAFNFAPSGSCTTPTCQQDVELVFVIDEQSVLSWTGFENVLNYVAGIIGTFNTASPSTRFGVWFTGSSNMTSPPTILTQNTAPPNLVTNVILPHVKANGTTNFVASVTAAISKFWPTGTPATGVPREILTIVGGPDIATDYSSVQSALTANNIQAWAVGVETGATQTATLQGLSSTGTYLHYQSVYDTTNLAGNGVLFEGQLLCPQTSLCGSGCLGFCTCTSSSGTVSNTCSCPTCASTTCTTYSCTTASVGCVGQPVYCNDNNACTTDTCGTNGCSYTPITCASGQTCVSSVGCVSTTTSCTGTGQGTCVTNPCYSQTCQGGVCVPGTATVCNDGNSCTLDTCSTTSGCVYTPYQCTQSSSCYTTSCQSGGATPSCVTNTTAISCDDKNACTIDTCKQGIGCIHTNYSCPATNISCSFPNGCVGQDSAGNALSAPQCLIANYTCGPNAALIGGIAGGVIAGIVVACVVAAALAAFFSRQGYLAYQARSAMAEAGVQNNAAYQENQFQGQTPFDGNP